MTEREPGPGPGPDELADVPEDERERRLAELHEVVGPEADDDA